MFVIVSAAREPQHLAHLGDMDSEHPNSQVTDYIPEDDHCEHRKENPNPYFLSFLGGRTQTTISLDIDSLGNDFNS